MSHTIDNVNCNIENIKIRLRYSVMFVYAAEDKPCASLKIPGTKQTFH